MLHVMQRQIFEVFLACGPAARESVHMSDATPSNPPTTALSLPQPPPLSSPSLMLWMRPSLSTPRSFSLLLSSSIPSASIPGPIPHQQRLLSGDDRPLALKGLPLSLPMPPPFRLSLSGELLQRFPPQIKDRSANPYPSLHICLNPDEDETTTQLSSKRTRLSFLLRSHCHQKGIVTFLLLSTHRHERPTDEKGADRTIARAANMVGTAVHLEDMSRLSAKETAVAGFSPSIAHPSSYASPAPLRPVLKSEVGCSSPNDDADMNAPHSLVVAIPIVFGALLLPSPSFLAPLACSGPTIPLSSIIVVLVTNPAPMLVALPAHPPKLQKN